MKNVLLALALCLALVGTGNAASYNVITRGVNDVKIHDYVVGTGAAAQVVEGPETLVVLDVPGTEEDNEEFLKFVRKLDKKVVTVVISHAHDHHWQGISAMFPGVPVYSPQAAIINAPKPQPEVQVEVPKAAPTKDKAPQSAPAKAQPSSIDKGKTPEVAQKPVLSEEPMQTGPAIPGLKPLENGKTTLGGVVFQVTSLPALDAVIIALPDQKTVIMHHLGYVGVHVPLPRSEARYAEMEKLNKAGYNWFIGGHGGPGGPEFITKAKEYTDFVTKTAAASFSLQEAKQNILLKYPYYAAPELLDVLLPPFMPAN